MPLPVCPLIGKSLVSVFKNLISAIEVALVNNFIEWQTDTGAGYLRRTFAGNRTKEGAKRNMLFVSEWYFVGSAYLCENS